MGSGGGIGGIGKNTAALEYLRNDNYGGSYDHIAWVELIGPLPDAFARQQKLHKRLGILAPVESLLAKNDLDGVVHATLDALHDLPGNTLLALDNANNRDEINYWKLALLNSGCRLLFTSRADIPNVADVLVGELAPDDAVRLFWHHYRPSTTPTTKGEEADALAKLLQDVETHTLLIEMLGKIGKQAGMSVADLQRHVANRFVFNEKLQRTVPSGSLTERKEPGLAETKLENLVLLLFQDITKYLTERERDLLRQIAVLPPIPHDPALLARLFGIAEEEETDFFNELDGLDKRSVPLRKGDAYQLHRLVRAVALCELGPKPENCVGCVDNYANRIKAEAR